jgi:DNA topoisomerase-1
LDALGIGRPSTYALIVSTILARKYVEKNQRQLLPTELGRTVNKILVQNFPELFNVSFTARMEENLDEIESGKKRFLDVTQNFYTPFKQAIAEVNSKQHEIKDSLQEETKENCPKCGKELIIRWGRNGKFMACTGYPDCKHTQPLEEPEQLDERCEKCGRNMVIKHGRFGRFLACSGYPECKNTQPISVGVNCPKDDCNGVIVEKRSRRGRTFFGCSNYPKCNFATWYKPVARKCSNCGNPYLEQRATQAKGEYLYCPACQAEMQEDEDSYRDVAYG